MSGVSRDNVRVRSTAEVFTRTDLVLDYINWTDKKYPDAFTDPNNNWCDNSAGDGQLLGEVLIRKVERALEIRQITNCTKDSIEGYAAIFENALRHIYGVDNQQSNVDLCRERLLCGHEEFRHIVENNIICADALEYDYSFDGSWEKKQAMNKKKDDLFDFGD